MYDIFAVSSKKTKHRAQKSEGELLTYILYEIFGENIIECY